MLLDWGHYPREAVDAFGLGVKSGFSAEVRRGAFLDLAVGCLPPPSSSGRLVHH